MCAAHGEADLHPMSDFNFIWSEICLMINFKTVSIATLGKNGQAGVKESELAFSTDSLSKNTNLYAKRSFTSYSSLSSYAWRASRATMSSASVLMRNS